ncbi:PLP-dependent aminotransferase family protein [Parapedobacter sp. SGR-10]|uniref:MocR-like pyridoxine biosynthesis transcription factor PdxR n=1 Tax=Parapedobacter sp. SGR-10 TaxID=2710879 RepID=UPI0013D8CCB6|nr:PLP-dependent aminotransferase family protein [Parapedobacter sp. SGR-10]NGF57283.1 PLP-dependent aminotransferase family protein [Parapedobacter sp. SGR-10]
MSSPAEIPFLSFIQLDRHHTSALYLQLAQQLVNAIQRGYLPLGIKLPGTRTLSQLLQVHRQTIVNAYQELEAQGWIETVPNKGTFVINNSHNNKHRWHTSTVSLVQYPERTGFDFSISNILNSPFEYASNQYQFNDGTPDVRLTQFDRLSSLYSASIKRKSTRRKFEHYNYEGSTYFREQLSNYLNYSRGLHISKNNLLITRGTEMSLYLIAKLLLKKDDLVLVAEWSNFAANMIFQDAGAKIETIPLDKDGIDTDAIHAKLKHKKVRLIYVTPHHHYPTTVPLSAERRIALLKLAQEYGFVIVEDDYDYDFQYEKGIAMPIASADVEGMVIYIGTFGKSLAPSFRAGFVVAPINLMSELQKYIGLIDHQGDILMEHVLGELIEEGDIHRFLKKSLKIYRERRDHLCNLLEQRFSDRLTYQKTSGGLALWLEWNNPIPLLRLAKQCQKRDLFIPKNILYQNRQTTAMRLGFGHMTTEEMTAALSILQESLYEIEG